MPTEAEIQAELDSQKVIFDEKQQKKVEELIKEAMGRAGKEARTEASEAKKQLDSLKTELEQARTDLSTAKTKTEKSEATDEVKSLEATIREMQNAHRSVQEERDRAVKAAQQKELEVKRANDNAINIRKEITLTQAANKINPFDVGVVVSLAKESVAWDSEKNKFVVVDPISQQPRLNSAFDPMTIDEYFAEYASKNPYMIKSGQRPGTGSSEANLSGVLGSAKFTHKQIFGKGSSSMLATKLAREDPKEYQRLKEMARQDGTINW